MAMCWAVLSFVTLFSDFGLSAATIQRKEIDQNTVSVLYFVGLGIGFVLTCILTAFAPLAAAIFNDNRLLLAVPAIALTLPINWLTAQHYALLNRTMRWTDLQIGAILSQAVGVVVAISIAFFIDILGRLSRRRGSARSPIPPTFSRDAIGAPPFPTIGALLGLRSSLGCISAAFRFLIISSSSSIKGLSAGVGARLSLAIMRARSRLCRCRSISPQPLASAVSRQISPSNGGAYLTL